MAYPYDGARHSESRRLNVMISLRTTAEVKAKLQAHAARRGHASLSAWAIEVLEHADKTVALHERRVWAGTLGQLGGHLTQLKDQFPHMAPDEVVAALDQLAGRLLKLQSSIIEGE